MKKIDPVKRQAYAEACDLYPDRHESHRAWSLFLSYIADRIGPSHPDHDEFVRSAEAYRKLSQCPNVPTR